MRIGNVDAGRAAFLAPMAGVCDKAFRTLCRSYGAGVVCSEMVSAKGLHYNDKKTASLMDVRSQSPCAIQIFGSEPEIMAEAAQKALEFEPDIIDINMGCPAPKIVGNGDGSALMREPEKMGKIVRAVTGAVSIPVTVKIRKGWDCDNSVLCARILEENGAAAITLHGRTRAEFYGGRADWDAIRRVKAAVSVPVIGNGDIFSAEAAVRMMEYTGCDAVMVARGAMGNPWLFTQINELIGKGEVKTYPSKKERIETALRHTEMIIAEKGESRGIKEARKHLAHYIKGMRGATAVKTRIFSIDNFADMEAALKGYADMLENL